MTATAAWISELAAHLRQPSRQAAADTDFGGPLPPPAAFLQTESDTELLHVFEVARRERLPVAVRGAGHSSGGQTSAPGGIVLSHRSQQPMRAITADSVEIPAHWPWSRVEALLRQSGLDLPISTSSLDTTVAGTLSAGGFGARSIQRGPQVDNVRALRLICMDGTVTWCSPQEEPELFCAALTGLGQVGVIDRIVFATRPHRGVLAATIETHTSFAALAERIAWMDELNADVPDYFCALAKQQSIQSFMASAHTSDSEAQAQRANRWTSSSAAQHQIMPTASFELGERQMPLAAWRQCRNLWCDYCFDASSFGAFAAFVDAELAHTLGGHLAYAMCIAPRKGPRFALDMRLPGQRRLFSLGLFYSVPQHDERGIATAMTLQRRALDECQRLGGRPYLYGCWGGAAGLSPASLSSLFGDGYRRLAALRSRFDPQGLLNPRALNIG